MTTIKKNARIYVLLGGILCQFCAGMLYSWSLYVRPLIETYGWERSQVTLTFSIATLMIPIVMLLAGKILPKIGPTKTALIGAGLLVIGLFIVALIPSLMALYIGYGVLAGAGVGFIYGVPIATCVKWFPDRKGLISGLAVAGFGLGSIIFSPICTYLLTHFSTSTAFLGQGVITLVGMLIGAPMMKVAPDGYIPEGWTPPQGNSIAVWGYSSKEMLKLSQYWLLVIMYLFANLAGLFAIGNASPISQEIAGLTAVQAGVIVSVLSIANTCGRFIAGAATDKFGPKNVVIAIFALNILLFFTLNFMTSFALIAVGIAGIAICFGGMMGAYPALVLEYFGPKYYSANYAFVFLAYGVGGLVANFIASFGSYSTSFLIIGSCCLIGGIMAVMSKKPKAV